MNYLPVGSQKATEFYAECALEAGVAFVNCIPVFIASDPSVGAAVPRARRADRRRRHQGPARRDDRPPRADRPVRASAAFSIDRTYQLNTGGNTDFLNMLNRDRLASKKESQDRGGASRLAERRSKTKTSTSAHRTTCRGRTTTRSASCAWKAQMFGGVPMNLELRLSVEDLPEPRRRGDRHDPLRQDRAGTAARAGPIDAPVRLLLQASAKADDRRSRCPCGRGLLVG